MCSVWELRHCRPCHVVASCTGLRAYGTSKNLVVSVFDQKLSDFSEPGILAWYLFVDRAASEPLSARSTLLRLNVRVDLLTAEVRFWLMTSVSAPDSVGHWSLVLSFLRIVF